MRAMRRRIACSAIVVLAASPALLAQVGDRKARIGFFTEAPLDQVWQRAALEPFRRGLRDLGYVEGQNIVIDFRSADGKYERLRELADEVAAAPSGCAGRGMACAGTGRQECNPHAARGRGRRRQSGRHGARSDDGPPGRQRHWHQFWAGELVAKRLQVVRELVPSARRIGILFNPDAGVTRAGLDSGIVNWERTLGGRSAHTRRAGRAILRACLRHGARWDRRPGRAR